MDNSIFVFGSNLKGIHKKGAALTALEQYGAIPGQGIGMQGRAYAIPTKESPWRSLDLVDINKHVADFIVHARDNSSLIYILTPIGCGLAGYHVSNIAPMFRCAYHFPNIRFPKEFITYLDNGDWF